MNRSILAAALVLSALVPIALAGAPALGPFAQAATSPQAAPNPWPQDLTSGGRTFRVFQPAVTGLDGTRAYLVTQVQLGGGTAGAAKTGEAKLQAEVMASDVPGEVELNRFRLREFTVDGSPAGAEDTKALGDTLYGVALTTTRTNLLQGMQIVNARGSSTPGLSDGMPRIVVVHVPSVPLVVDGEPRTAALGLTGWQRTTNTPFVLLKSPDGSWWTRLAGEWQSAPGLDFPFSPSDSVPPADVTSALGTRPPAPEAVAKAAPANPTPARRPARAMLLPGNTVLVSIDGDPRLEDAAPGVRRVANTNSTLLTPDGSTYFLLSSGRWFRTGDLDAGPWSRVAPADVPAAFAGLPSSRRFDQVRASVPGTRESNEAALAAREIRTVTLNRSGASPAVGGIGDSPSWADTGAPGVRWLPTATQPVLDCGGKAYCCDSGAWFVAPTASGPWSLCDQVPDAIYAIPPSCPVYPCTYVWVFGSTPDSVSFGFSPGYLGTYLADGTPVYGTGYGYPAPAEGAAAAPAYPQTYGFDPAYDSQTGTFTPPADPEDGYAYYGAPDLYPSCYGATPWTGWGWCPGWCTAWGYGWNNWWGWNHWGWWMNNWHPYYNRWGANYHPWQHQNLADARQRVAQRSQPLQNRSWANARGDVANAARPGVRSVGGANRPQAPAMTPQDRESAMQNQFRGMASDAPAAFRGPGNEYGGYAPEAYRPWTGTGSEYGGNWGFHPLAGPDGFHPPQQFVAPGAYWGNGTAAGDRVGPNAGPYASPQGHGGWGTYDHWAGEGIRGTEYGRGGSRGGASRGGGRR